MSLLLPDALDHVAEIVGDGRLALFLDFDGTLTPIVDHPEDARLPDRVRATLLALGRRVPVGVLSGRDLADVRQRVGIAGLWYAGSHGFDIAGPHGEHSVVPEGSAALPALAQARERLERLAEAVPGVALERKRLAVAVHYRQVAEAAADEVRAAVQQVVDDHRELQLFHGKMVVEVQPAAAWHKGKALTWLMEVAELPPDVRPLYIGDDTTDENAFREIRDRGIGILVAHRPIPSAARYRLRDPDEVARFLDAVLAALRPEAD